jgi:hypothetical protein
MCNVFEVFNKGPEISDELPVGPEISDELPVGPEISITSWPMYQALISLVSLETNHGDKGDRVEGQSIDRTPFQD